MCIRDRPCAPRRPRRSPTSCTGRALMARWRRSRRGRPWATWAAPVGWPRTRGRAAADLKELESGQKSRRTRRQRDSLDRALVDLAALYRDVLAVQLGARVPAYQSDQAATVEQLARAGRPESTLRRIEAALACREAVSASVAPVLAVEAMALTLQRC